MWNGFLFGAVAVVKQGGGGRVLLRETGPSQSPY